MFANRDKHYPSRFGQTSPATAVPKFIKPVTKINFGRSGLRKNNYAILFKLNCYVLFCISKGTFSLFFEPKKSEKHITFINFTDHMSLCLATFHVEIYFDSLFQALESIFHCEVQIVWKKNFKTLSIVY